MKKEKKENNKKFFVLTNGIVDKMYNSNEVIAYGNDKNLLEKYKLQLINNNYTNNFEIEEREHVGWSSLIRYQGYELEEYKGYLYPNKNIKLAESQQMKLIQELKSTKSNLEDLKDELFGEDIVIIDNAIKILDRKIENVSNQELNISMM